MRSKYKPEMLTYEVVHTDTFGGEANYSWVRKAEITVPHYTSRYQLVRDAKKAVGTNGVWSMTEEHGDDLTIVYRAAKCVITFITLKDA